MALSAFFSLLFLGRLPRNSLPYLPKEEQPGPATADAATDLPKQPEQPPQPKQPAQPWSNEATLRTEGALMLLTLLQREGRLIDFLRESLDAYDDAAIGVAVRDIHRDCRKILDAHVKVEPVMPGHEDEAVSLPKGFDPAEVRVIGKALGEPPWNGILIHHGWRVVDVKLPTPAGDVDRHLIAPAEVKLA